MNLELLGAFNQTFPEAVDGHLERIKKDESGGCATFVVTIQFNRAGSLVAVGCNDGRIELWDFVTRRIAKVIVAHSHPAVSLSWSRNSRQLLSASTDNTACIWDIVTGQCLRTITFPCPVMKVQFHPRNANLVLVCPFRYPPVLLDVTTGNRTIIKHGEENDPSVVASFDRRGKHIYTGNSRGTVCIYDTSTLEMVNQFRSANTAANAAIKSIEFSRRSDYFLLNCADRCIRIYNCSDALKSSEPEASQKLRDIVSGSHWRKCCFSGDGEYVCAGSMKQHAIYIWERATGTLMKILHGQKGEILLDVIWHPLRPIIVSLSNSSTKEQISIWAQAQVQNWSAFAPDFKELDENVEYEEHESEFDITDEDKVEDNKMDDVEEDDFVDIETVEPVAALLSSDEEQEPEDILMFLAVAPDVDCPDPQPETSAAESDVPPTPAKRAKFGGDKGDAPGSPSPMDSSSSGAMPCQTYKIELPDAPVDEVHPLALQKKHGGGGGGAKAPSSRTSETSGDASSLRKGRNRSRK